MFGISGAELIVILLVALVVLGPDRLPGVARKAGQVLGELRQVSSSFQAEMRSAMAEPPPTHGSGAAPTTPTTSPEPLPGAAPDGYTAVGDASADERDGGDDHP